MRSSRSVLGVALVSSVTLAAVLAACGGGGGAGGGKTTSASTGGTTSSASGGGHGGAGGQGGHAGTGGSGGSGGAPSKLPSTTASTTLALTSDDHALWVVNPESDSVSIVDPTTRALVDEIPLGPKPPAMDAVTKRYDPSIAPRGLAIVRDAKVYVAAQAAGRIFVIDAATRAVKASIPVPAAPVSVVASPDGSAVYVVSHEAGKLTRIDTATDAITGTLTLTEHPWGITASADGAWLYVTHLLVDPGVTVVDAHAWSIRNKVPLAEQAPAQPVNKLVPNGVARGLYGVVARPGTGEIWVPHLLLAIKTAQPDLDFQSTVFPTISTLKADAAGEGRRLLFKPPVAGVGGSFTDSVSGPRALAFTPDGKLGLLALAQSEDVMVFDAASGNEISLVRPLPSTLLEGIVVDHAGTHAYVNGRASHDISFLTIDASNAFTPVKVDGAPVDRLKGDPMPESYRKGLRLFYTANQAAFPITKNFWVACASCHIEGGSDAVTWLFKQGPRDTPSNAGGPINTGFQLRQGLRNAIVQYDKTIQDEQGGTYDHTNPLQLPDLLNLSDFVNYAIPLPPNPHVAADGTLTASQTSGKALFASRCESCHSGAYLTDSGAGNATLDFSGPILLHDIGTCVTTGATPDKTLDDVAGNTHTACDFDTPTLRGIFATPPYLHDGSAATLLDVVKRLTYSADLSDADKASLVDYLETL